MSKSKSKKPEAATTHPGPAPGTAVFVRVEKNEPPVIGVLTRYARDARPMVRLLRLARGGGYVGDTMAERTFEVAQLSTICTGVESTAPEVRAQTNEKRLQREAQQVAVTGALTFDEAQAARAAEQERLDVDAQGRRALAKANGHDEQPAKPKRKPRAPKVAKPKRESALDRAVAQAKLEDRTMAVPGTHAEIDARVAHAAAMGIDYSAKEAEERELANEFYGMMSQNGTSIVIPSETANAIVDADDMYGSRDIEQHDSIRAEVEQPEIDDVLADDFDNLPAPWEVA